MTIPKQTAGTDAVVAEQASENASEGGTDAWDSDVDTVTPKPTSGKQTVSRQFVDMSSPAIDQLIYGDLLACTTPPRAGRVGRFYLDQKGALGRLLVTVKGGKTVTPQYVHVLSGTLEAQRAQMGVLITVAKPSKGVIDAINHGGTYTWPVNGQTFPRL